MRVDADDTKARIARALQLRDGMGFLARVVSARANLLFHDLTAQDKMTPRQFGALLTLHQHGRLTLTVLAQHISVDRSTLTEMVRRMVRDGWSLDRTTARIGGQRWWRSRRRAKRHWRALYLVQREFRRSC